VTHMLVQGESADGVGRCLDEVPNEATVSCFNRDREHSAVSLGRESNGPGRENVSLFIDRLIKRLHLFGVSSRKLLAIG
jgi:hypothetical protein